MKINMIVTSLLMISSAFAMEQKGNELKDLFLQEPPSLKFQAAWQAVRSGQDVNLELTGEQNIVELCSKINTIQEAFTKYDKKSITELEKKLLINLIDNLDLSNDEIKSKFASIIEKYLQNAEFENKAQLLNKMLIYALEHNKHLLAMLSIYAGANVNVVNDYGNTALGLAATSHNKEIVKMLIDAGADVNQTFDGTTVLLNTIDYYITFSIYKYCNCGITIYEEEILEIIRILIESEADVNACDDDGDTALMLVAEAKNFTIREFIAKMLIEAGAKVNAEDKWGNTPLVFGIDGNNKTIVQMLIDAGADVNYCNENNPISPLRRAENNCNAEIIQMLKEAGARQ